MTATMPANASVSGAPGALELLGALADPVRLDIVVLLARGPQAAGHIARRFDISRPAVSRHLRVLREAGLVVDTARGRERLYALDTERVEHLRTWLGALAAPPSSVLERARASGALDALDLEVRRAGRASRSRATLASRPGKDTA